MPSDLERAAMTNEQLMQMAREIHDSCYKNAEDDVTTFRDFGQACALAGVRAGLEMAAESAKSALEKLGRPTEALIVSDVIRAIGAE